MSARSTRNWLERIPLATLDRALPGDNEEHRETYSVGEGPAGRTRQETSKPAAATAGKSGEHRAFAA